MKINPTASRWAYALVLIIAAGGLFWWIQNRPSFFSYQARKQIGGPNQSAAIAHYKKKLTKKDLPKEEEIRLRMELTEFYIEALTSSNGTAISYTETYDYIDAKSLEAKKVDVKVSDAADHPFYTAAKKECDRVLELEPSNAKAHYYMGILYADKKMDAFAIESLNKSRQSDPNVSAPLVVLSEIYLSKENAVQARDAAMQALTLEPDNNKARLALIFAYALQGEANEALREYERLSDTFLSIPEVRAMYARDLAELNYWEKAADEMSMALEGNPQNGRIHYQFGLMLLDQGLYDQAAAQFTQAYNLMPGLKWSMVMEAYAYSRKGRCDQIDRVSQAFLRDDLGSVERHPWAYLVMAWKHLCNGDDARAHLDLTEALRLNDHLTEAINLKSELLIDRGQFRQLGDLIRPLLDRKVNQAGAYTLLAQSFLLQGHLDEAEEAASSAIKFNSREEWAMVWLGLARAYNGDIEAGERAIDEAATMNPYDPMIKGTRAYFKGLNRNEDAAISELKEILTQYPHAPFLWTYLGDIQLLKGYGAEAIQSYQSALTIKPYLLHAHLGLARAYKSKNMDEAAQKVRQDSKRINSNPNLYLLARPFPRGKK